MTASRIQKWKWVSTIITSLSVLRFMLTHSKVTFMHKTYTASDALTWLSWGSHSRPDRYIKIKTAHSCITCTHVYNLTHLHCNLAVLGKILVSESVTQVCNFNCKCYWLSVLCLCHCVCMCACMHVFHCLCATVMQIYIITRSYKYCVAVSVFTLSVFN